MKSERGCLNLISFIWLAAFVLFLIIEAATVSLTSIWFAAGALIALLCTLLGAPLWLQIVIFILVSAVTMYFTRPLAKKYLNAKRKPTNADRVFDMPCIVTEEIDNLHSRGTVSVGGKIWTARAMNGAVIPKGSIVRVLSIEGVKLIVLPVTEKRKKEE
jgi:membrane protein implicated in regulation of membrane protease activity